MKKYTNVYEMNALWLVMEFERLVLLEAEGKTDETVNYNAHDLRSQIEFRLNEYNNIK